MIGIGFLHSRMLQCTSKLNYLGCERTEMGQVSSKAHLVRTSVHSRYNASLRTGSPTSQSRTLAACKVIAVSKKNRRRAQTRAIGLAHRRKFPWTFLGRGVSVAHEPTLRRIPRRLHDPLSSDLPDFHCARPGCFLIATRSCTTGMGMGMGASTENVPCIRVHAFACVCKRPT